MVSFTYICTRISAFFGNKDDLCRMGIYYYEGNEVKRDLDRAARYFKKASDKHNTKALYYLGLIELERLTDVLEYAPILRYFELARISVLKAVNSINEIEKTLFNLEKSPEVASTLFKIGYMYANDSSVHRNYEKASQYYKRAASFGNYHAKNQLGQLLLKGEGRVEANRDSAFTYLFSAARDGFNPAKETLIHYFSNDETLNELKTHLDEPNFAAIYASMLYDGLYVESDFEGAEEHFRSAARERHPDAIFHLGLIYNARGDKARAEEYFSHARSLNHLEALNMLSATANPSNV